MKRFAGVLLLAASFTFAADRVPFVAVFTSSVQGGTLPDWCSGYGLSPEAVVGAGHATHLGLFSAREGICLDPASPEFSHGKFELTAANGDTITGRSAGFISIIDGIPTIQGTFFITGGTGRFAGAAGDGTATGTLNPDGSSNDFVMTGRITRPNH